MSALIALVQFVCYGCRSHPDLTNVEMRSQYRDGFTNFRIPSIEYIETNGAHVDSLRLPFQQVWEAAVLVMMQSGPIIKAIEKDGLIVSPPFCVRLKDGDGVSIYVLWLDELYRSANNPNAIVIKVSDDDRRRYLETALAQIAVQAQGNWPYLSN